VTWWIAALTAVLAALVAAWISAERAARQAAELVAAARRIAAARKDGKLTDVPSELAGSLNRLARDIERSVAELSSERRRLAAILEGLADGVIAVDERADVSIMNKAALEILGLAETPVARPIYTILRSPELQDLIANPEHRATEMDLPDRGRRVLLRATPLTGGGYILVMSDVTEVRRLETVRRDFVANVSHELRTPVSIIRANAETLLDGAVDDPVHARPLLEAAHRNAERLSRIITDLLDLSRLEAGRYEINRQAVPAAEITGRAIDAVERAAAERGTAITAEVPPALAVLADDKALEQVLVNYLENAVKYTPAGGQVAVEARRTGDRIRIEVRDNGPGIEARHRARVFERFYRIDPGRSRDMGGTGLGLSIVKHMAEAMGGAVGVDPVAPHGSAFWIELQAAAD
jgi:two-component system, OmpR family, phosphate regulon sensor histidine kinase PhoR